MPLRTSKKDSKGHRKESKHSKSSKHRGDDHVTFPKSTSGYRGDEVVINNNSKKNKKKKKQREDDIGEDFESDGVFTQDEDVYTGMGDEGNISEVGAPGSVYGDSDDEDQVHRELTSDVPFTPFLDGQDEQKQDRKEKWPSGSDLEGDLFNPSRIGKRAKKESKRGSSSSSNSSRNKESGGRKEDKGREVSSGNLEAADGLFESEQHQQYEQEGKEKEEEKEDPKTKSSFSSSSSSSRRQPPPRVQKARQKRQQQQQRTNTPQPSFPPPPPPSSQRTRPVGGFRNVQLDSNDDFFKEEDNEDQKISAEKAYLLEKLRNLETRGEELSQNFTMNSDINAMRLEYGRILDRRQRDKTRTSFERNLNLAANAFEQVSKSRYIPKKFNGALEGLPQYVMQHLDEYEPFIDKISEQYGGFQIAQDQDPIVALVIQFVFHAGIFLFDRLVKVYVLNSGDSGVSASDVQDTINATLTEERKKWQKAFEEMQDSHSKEMKKMYDSFYDRPPETNSQQFPGFRTTAASYTQPPPPQYTSSSQGYDPTPSQPPPPRDVNAIPGPTAQEMADEMYRERNKNGPRGVSVQLSQNQNGGGVFDDLDKLEKATRLIQPI